MAQEDLQTRIQETNFNFTQLLALGSQETRPALKHQLARFANLHQKYVAANSNLLLLERIRAEGEIDWDDLEVADIKNQAIELQDTIHQISDEISIICKDIVSEYSLMNEGIEQLQASELEIKHSTKQLTEITEEIDQLHKLLEIKTQSVYSDSEVFSSTISSLENDLKTFQYENTQINSKIENANLNRIALESEFNESLKLANEAHQLSLSKDPQVEELGLYFTNVNELMKSKCNIKSIEVEDSNLIIVYSFDNNLEKFVFVIENGNLIRIVYDGDLHLNVDLILKLSLKLQTLYSQLTFTITNIYHTVTQINFISNLKSQVDLDLVWDDNHDDFGGDVLISTKSGKSIVIGYGVGTITFKGMEPSTDDDLKEINELVKSSDFYNLADIIRLLESEY
jgi:hypothetical protein